MNLHYVFGLAPDFGGKPWCYAHYLAVHSAAVVNQPAAIHFWYEHEPAGEWWERTKPYLTLHQITAPQEIFGRPLVHPAHKADVLRLQKLQEFGGVYMDCDVWCLRPFAEIAHGGFWMGRQGKNYGLCNATMGGDSGAPFLARWIEQYRTFRSRGRDQYWDEHSVRLPLQLAQAHPTEITILPHDRLFWPDWNYIHEVFQLPGKWLVNAYSVHLWETYSYSWLSQLTPETLNRGSEIGRLLAARNVI